jgi:threonyl-tRNA synthetase
MDKEKLEHLRHSLAHLLAAAVLELWPEALLTLGPTVENGFYYDMDFSGKNHESGIMNQGPTEEDLPKIEKKMREILKKWDKFELVEVTEKKARELFKGNQYKQEIIDDYKGGQLTIVKSGNFTDLCRGGHIDSAKKIDPDCFKLVSIAGAYWRGDEKNKMLTRIYGAAFETKEELDKYLELLEEAKKRDHKKLGLQLGLFMFHASSPGMPYWLPNGMIVMNELINFWRIEHTKRGYQEISTPLVNKKELWETSGHWDHYKDDMFIANMGDNEIYGIKPMNCPNAMIVYGSKLRSYKDLPLRLSDTDTLHRYELSGTLNGLFRVRSFRQDDSHNFIREDQIEEEYGQILDIAERFYSIFGIEYKLRLGTRPEKFLGDVETWDRAEASLKKILDQKAGKNKYLVMEGDGAFYGPKIDILMLDALGREWQTGTIQLDFQQPRRFGLVYIDHDGKKKTPVVIHRVIYGSIERFLGILIEHTAGALPLWLSPVQVAVLPISDKTNEYAKDVAKKIKEAGIRVELDERNESIGKKIRENEIQKIPCLVVVGEKEAEAGKIAVRRRNMGDIGQMGLEEFIADLKEEIEKKK